MEKDPGSPLAQQWHLSLRVGVGKTLESLIHFDSGDIFPLSPWLAKKKDPCHPQLSAAMVKKKDGIKMLWVSEPPMVSHKNLRFASTYFRYPSCCSHDAAVQLGFFAGNTWQPLEG